MVLSPVEKDILVAELGLLLQCLPHAGPGTSVPLGSTKKQWRSYAPCPPLVPKTVLQVVAVSTGLSTAEWEQEQHQGWCWVAAGAEPVGGQRFAAPVGTSQGTK